MLHARRFDILYNISWYLKIFLKIQLGKSLTLNRSPFCFAFMKKMVPEINWPWFRYIMQSLFCILLYIKFECDFKHYTCIQVLPKIDLNKFLWKDITVTCLWDQDGYTNLEFGLYGGRVSDQLSVPSEEGLHRAHVLPQLLCVHSIPLQN